MKKYICNLFDYEYSSGIKHTKNLVISHLKDIVILYNQILYNLVCKFTIKESRFFDSLMQFVNDTSTLLAFFRLSTIQLQRMVNFLFQDLLFLHLMQEKLQDALQPHKT